MGAVGSYFAVMPRPYHLTLLGATGFTGRLVAEYLYQAYPPGAEAAHGITWAIAGRSADKLAATKQELGLHGVDAVVADSHDAESLAAMCRQTDVVVTTVGPYALHGSLLVAACVENGTDYCDLSGEVPWMRRMIDAHHASARAAGVRIVHSCGFDSVPSDIGVLHHQRVAQARYGEFCESVEMIVAAAKGGFSGGTFASLDNVLAEAAASDKVASVLLDPYGLNAPAPDGTCDAQNDQRGVRFSESFQVYTAPFVMAGINTRIVRRSVALAGFPYGRDFCYTESVATGPALGGRLTAAVTAAGIGVFASAGAVGKTLRGLAPKPGDGPDAAARESGYFKLKFFGRTPSGKTLRTQVVGKRDPGYGATSRMLAEAGVALVETRGRRGDQSTESDAHSWTGGGVLTPALAIGEELLARLPGVGIRFED